MKLVDNFFHGIVHTGVFFTGSLKILGTEHVPTNGPYIVVLNHMSKADPPLVMISLPQVKMRFFAAEKWQNHLIFSPLLDWGGAIYINRGEADRRAIREALEALKNGSVFGLAPEGTRSRLGALIRARDGAAYLATRAKVPILPVGVVNTDSLGYNMAHLSRTNMEVRFGKPFELPDLGRRPKGIELGAFTHYIMIHIAALLPPKYWGYYRDSLALQALLEGRDPWPYCVEAEVPTGSP
jgi:1-acyl-sn-glycerol-3-phosphate acyltransferase